MDVWLPLPIVQIIQAEADRLSTNPSAIIAQSLDIFARHRLLCGNAAQFQGDERDVIFLSMVDGPPDDGQHVYRGEGPKDIFKKRYNIAVSRARDQLWVVHSIDPEAHLKSGDLRKRLIEHARDPQILLREIEKRADRTE
jgi:hypothetical protein